MKKILASTLVVCALLAVAACSKTKPAEAPKGAPAELSLWTFNELHLKFYQSMAESWNAANPDKQIVLKGEVFPYEDMHTKLLVALQAGTGAPDISDIEISKFPNFLKGDIQLVPLNDVIDPERANFVQARLAIYAKDGKNYGMDFHVGAEVMYYNMDLIKAAGVDIDAIDTWDDYVKAGIKVKEKTGKPMCTVEVTEQWSFWPLISQQNSDFLDKDGNVILDNEINVKTLQFLYDLIYKYKIAVAAPGGFHHSEEYYGFMNKGGAASIWMPMWYMNRFTDYMTDLKGKIAIRPLPRWTKDGYRSAGMGGTGTSVTLQAKNQELAKAFLMYAKGSKEGNLRLWKDLGFDPPRWDVWTDPAMKEKNKFTEFFQNEDIFGMLVQVKDEIYPVNIVEKTPQVIDKLKSTVMIQALQQKTKTPAAALKEAADQVR
jgi:arabinosaccharide transport system substrate-binding protein